MSQLNEHQQQLLSKTVTKLGNAMGKLEFKRNMTAEETDKIRQEINEVKGELFMMGDINPDIEHLELFQKAADLVDQALNILTPSHLV